MNTEASPLVSVVLPVRNAACTVAAAIASVRRQTFADWELVAIDDGSTDATPEKLAACVREDARVRVVSRPAEGVAAALNAGLAHARGRLIARMDADDEAHPERLARQAAFLLAPENAGIGLVGCGVAYGGDRAANAGYALHVDWMNALTTPEEIALHRFIESPLAHPSVMFRRELVAAHGGYRAGDFPEDYELWLRWLEAGVRMAKVPEMLLTWHDGPARLSRTDARYRPAAFFAVKAPFVARWVERELKRRCEVNESTRENGDTPPQPEVWVWGAGRPARKRAAPVEANGVRIAGFIDVDAKKTGRGVGGTGRPVIAPSALPPVGKILVLGYVATRGARESIRGELRARGYVEGRDFMMCA